MANQRENIDRATAIFKAAVVKHRIRRFNARARSWAGAAIWIAADETNRSTTYHELAAHFRIRTPSMIRACKIQLRQFSTMSWSRASTARLYHDDLELALEKLQELIHESVPPHSPERPAPSNDDESELEEERDSLEPPLAHKNKGPIRQALSQQSRLRHLATTLASRFAARHYTSASSYMMFTVTCIIVSIEALLRKAIPHLSNLAEVLAASVCFGGSHWTLQHKYQNMVRWLQNTFLQLPWIPDEQKRPFDESLEALPPPSKSSKKRKLKDSLDTHRANGTRKRGDLVRFYPEIIEFDPATFGKSGLSLDDEDEDMTEAQEEGPPSAPLSLSYYRWTRSKLRARQHSDRRELVERAEESLRHVASGTSTPPDVDTRDQYLHSANLNHYQRLLLSGETPSTLATSNDPSHFPVDGRFTERASESKYRQHIGRILRERQCSTGELSAEEDLFLPDEMESYIRAPDEVELARRLAYSRGIFDTLDEKQRNRHAKQISNDAQTKRAHLRQAEKLRIEQFNAGMGRVRQKRAREDDSDPSSPLPEHEEQDRLPSPQSEAGSASSNTHVQPDWMAEIVGRQPAFDDVIQSLSGASYAAKFADDQVRAVGLPFSDRAHSDLAQGGHSPDYFEDINLDMEEF